MMEPVAANDNEAPRRMLSGFPLALALSSLLWAFMLLIWKGVFNA
jgi:hypothetical protein